MGCSAFLVGIYGVFNKIRFSILLYIYIRWLQSVRVGAQSSAFQSVIGSCFSLSITPGLSSPWCSGDQLLLLLIWGSGVPIRVVHCGGSALASPYQGLRHPRARGSWWRFSSCVSLSVALAASCVRLVVVRTSEDTVRHPQPDLVPF